MRETFMVIGLIAVAFWIEDHTIGWFDWGHRKSEVALVHECPDCYGVGVLEGELCPLCKGRVSP